MKHVAVKCNTEGGRDRRTGNGHDKILSWAAPDGDISSRSCSSDPVCNHRTQLAGTLDGGN